MDSTQTKPDRNAPELSLFLPVLDEEENLRPMHEKIKAALDTLGKSAEVIFVDDGSTDKSLAILKEIAASDNRVRVISLRRNYGQTAAMSAGIDAARGTILIPMDADLQNDPADIPRLLAKLDEGCDVCSGWRHDRRDDAVRRNFPSIAANRLISWVSGVTLHDFGCSLKAYRREIIKDVKLYGEMHRFIPIYASWFGARVTEIPVAHHARAHGHSKYGMERVTKVILDLLVVKFLAKYATKPIYLFGGFGLLTLGLALLSGLYAVYLKLFEGVSFILTPLPLLTVMALITGLMSILMGLLAELVTRTYYESQGKPVYLVKG
ncbi:MAG TPA: glycosyltransferase family 2 protein, partial [Pyrinomonadaceae bacterium]|nr:glycosyltransferase family 2 protein [Pyrinomonadaceae bacterium]